ncbi:MAG: acyl-CoA dehydrogenase, partial [Hyphomicrobium sp.]
MVELLYCVLVLAGVIALGMRKAPLWAWAAYLAIAALLWQGPVHGSAGLFGFLLWLFAIAFGALAVPLLRRRALIAPAFKFVKGTLPKVSDTE